MLNNPGLSRPRGVEIATDRWGHSGNVAVVWRSGQAIYGAVYEPSSGWSTSTMISDQDFTPETPQVTLGGDGVATAVWCDFRAPPAFRCTSIKSATYSGSEWSAPETLPTLFTADEPDIGADANGNVTAIWNEATNAYGPPELIAAAYKPRGDDWSERISVEQGAALVFRLEIAVGPDGSIAATLARGDGLPYGYVAHAAYGLRGHLQEPEVPALAGRAQLGCNNKPTVSVGGGGTALVAWRSCTEDLRGTVLKTSRHGPGLDAGWDAPQTVIATLASEILEPHAVAMDGHDNAYISWLQIPGATDSEEVMLMSSYMAAGERWLPSPVKISESVHISSLIEVDPPVLATSYKGDATVAYTSLEQDIEQVLAATIDR